MPATWRDRSRPRGVAAAALLLVAGGCQAFSGDFAEFGNERLRGQRDRAAQRDTVLELRLDALLEPAMQAQEVGCWLVLGAGNPADPMFGYLSATGTQADGRAALLICRGPGGLQRSAIGRGLAANAGFYDVVEPADDDEMGALLARRLEAADPGRIAVDRAAGVPLADGLSAADAVWLEDAVGPRLASRLVSSAPLVESFLGGMLDSEAPLFGESARLTVALLRYALSDQVVVAAGTSRADLEWAVRERAALFGLELAYPPQAVVYRSGVLLTSAQGGSRDPLLQPGDLFFLSVGVRYLGYANRYGRWAYLLREGERSAPAWVDAALAELAAAVEDAGGALRPGQGAAEAETAARAALGRLTGAAVGVARVGWLRDGPIDVLAAPRLAWQPRFRIAADTAVAITVRAPFSPIGAAGAPASLMSLETVLLTASGARFIVPPQRTALLID